MPRPKSNKRVARLSVSLDQDDHATLKRMAEKLDLSTAWVVRRAVSEFIDKHGNGAESNLPLRRSNHEAA